jgi:hypothetical protein
MDDRQFSYITKLEKQMVILTHISHLNLHQYLWHSLLFIYISQASPINLKTRFKKVEDH